MNISIVGTGNVAYHMARAFSKAEGHRIVCVCGRSIEKAKATFTKKGVLHIDSVDNLPLSDVVIIAVSDDSISAVSKSLSSNSSITESMIVHTSGTVGSNVLQAHAHHGVLYPLQTFTKGQRMSYKDIPFCISANTNETARKLQQLAAHVTNDVRLIDDQQRAEVHLSAVIANNMVNHLIYLAEQRLEKQGINGDILTPLIQQTVKKLVSQSARAAQTGPARRADLETIKKHLAKLEDGSPLRAVYEILSESIIKTYQS